MERGQGVLPLGVSPGYAIDELVFAGVGGRVLKPLRHTREVRSGERRPLWRGTELGGDAVAVTALAVSPRFGGDRTVLAATNAGMYVSNDAGDTFTPWNERLSPRGIVALTMTPHRVVFALGVDGTLWRRALLEP